MFQYIRLFLFLQFLDLVTTYATITRGDGAIEGNAIWSYLLSFCSSLNIFILMIVGKTIAIVIFLTCLYLLTVISTHKVYKILNALILVMCVYVVFNNIVILSILLYLQ